jgi:alpha-tubulin suppressor-like RCC1 family protein
MMGCNDSGQLGRDVGGNATPIKVDIPAPVADLACGWGFVLALTRSGEVYWWGENEDLELQFSNPGHPTPAMTFSSLPSLLKLTAGSDHILGLQKGGAAISLGWDFYGQCGRGMEDEAKPSSDPFQVLPEGSQDISCGTTASFVLMEDGSLFSCGHNNHGQLGIGTEFKKNCSLQKVMYHGSPIAFFGSAAEHSFLISEDGELYLWGKGELGMDSGKLVPTLLPNWKWELPRSYIWGKWISVFQWLFLGRMDEFSPFKKLHIEIVFHFVAFVCI